MKNNEMEQGNNRSELTQNNKRRHECKAQKDGGNLKRPGKREEHTDRKTELKNTHEKI